MVLHGADARGGNRVTGGSGVAGGRSKHVGFVCGCVSFGGGRGEEEETGKVRKAKERKGKEWKGKGRGGKGRKEKVTKE